MRLVHTCSKVVVLVLVWWTASLGQMYGNFFQEFGMTALPALTTLVIKMSAGVLHPAVLIAGGLLGLLVLCAGHFGLVDKALPALVIGDLVLICMLLFVWLVGLQIPFRKMQATLGS